MRLGGFVKEALTYEGYCYQLDCTAMGISETTLIDNLGDEVYEYIHRIAQEVSLPVKALVDALKNKDTFKLLTAVGYSIKALVDLVIGAIRLIRSGIIEVFREIHRGGYVDFLKKGAIDMDKLLKKFPLLKKMTGPMVGGVLLVMWFQQAFIGDPDEDFNMDYIVDAVKGKFSLYDLFVSPTGMFDVLLLVLGGYMEFGWWLNTHIEFMIAALIYTGAVKTPAIRNKLKKILPIKG